MEVINGKFGLRATRVGPYKGVVEECIGSLNLREDPGGVGKVARV